MLKKIFIGILLIIAGLVIAASTQPNDFKIERSTLVTAPAEIIYMQINDFKNWKKWSPWEKMDPQMKSIYQGPTEGQGSMYSWSGNSKVGSGKMTILESKPSSEVRIQLAFEKPMAATNEAIFRINPEGNQFKVTWSMTGNRNFVSKIICLFMSMEKMVGPDFEKGLAELKTVSENPSTISAKAPPPAGMSPAPAQSLPPKDTAPAQNR